MTPDTDRQPEDYKLPSDKDTTEDITIIVSDTAIIVSDTDDDEDGDDHVVRRSNKRNTKRSIRDSGEERNTKKSCKSTADSDSRSTDSDVGSCSSAHMSVLVAACASK